MAAAAERRWDFEPYGFLFTQVAHDTSGLDGDRHLNLVPLGPDGEELPSETIFSANATRAGILIDGPGGGNKTALGTLEIDFDTGDGAPRIRHAYLDWGNERNRLVAGKTWSVVSQLNPLTVNNDNLWNLGNTYDRLSQVRGVHKFGLATLEYGIMNFFEGEQVLPGADGDAVLDNGNPQLQARVAYDLGDGYIALGASAGDLEVQMAGGREEVDHRLYALEFRAPAGPVTFSGEAFYGEAGGFNSGVGQAVVIGTDGRPHSIVSRGGWFQIEGSAKDGEFAWSVLYGLDDPDDETAGVPGAILKNETALANFFWTASSRITFAVEVQWAETLHNTGETETPAEDLRTLVAFFYHFGKR